MTIKFGCHSYSWQMSYEKYKDDLPNILKVIKDAGFSGVEPDVTMLGGYRKNLEHLANDLAKLDLQIPAISLMKQWELLEDIEGDKEVQIVLRLLKQFPETKLNILNWPFYERNKLNESEVADMQQRTIQTVNTLAEMAAEYGVESTYHPNSSEGSLFRVEEDYELLFEGLNKRYVGYTPDTGHIVNGGMDPLEIFKKSRELINHVHFKDISAEGEFVPMGTGIIDHDALVEYLAGVNYTGWIMVEDESALSERDPNKATEKCGKYIQRYIEG